MKPSPHEAAARELFEAAVIPMAALSPDGTIACANPAFHALFGTEADKIAGRNLLSLCANPADPALIGALEDIGRGVNRFSLALKMLHSGGGALTVELESQPIPGQTDTHVILFRDATGAARQRDELMDAMHLMENAVQGSSDAIIAADAKGVVALFNPAAEQITGYRSQDVLGRMNARDIYPRGGAQRILRLLKGDSHGGPNRLIGFEVDILDSQGQPVPVMLNATLLTKEGKFVGTVGIFSDLRELLRTRQELERKTAELLTTQEKQDLISELAGAAAHELNQPLTSIYGYLELLQMKPSPERFNHLLERLFAEAERIKKTVQQIGRITSYQTRSYAGTRRILDILRSTDDA